MSLFVSALIPSRWLHHHNPLNQMTSQRPLLLVPSHGESGLVMLILGGYIQSITLRREYTFVSISNLDALVTWFHPIHIQGM